MGCVSSCKSKPKTKLTPKQLEKLNEKFKELDKNGDGFITAYEFIRGMQASNNNVCMTDAELGEVFPEIDTDGNIAIDLTEFLAKKTREKKKKVRNIFRRADNNGDGYITRAELKYAINNSCHSSKKWTDKKFNKIWDEADFNGDGKITFEEFVTAMNFGMDLDSDSDSDSDSE